MKKQLLNFVMVLAAAALVTGCAGGPGYSEMKGRIPALASDKGRIYFYRTSALGAAVQPAVKLNDQKVGTAKPKGFFFVDRAPGSYKVETSTEVSRQLSLVLETNQTRYVRLNISMGFFVGHVWPELVDVTAGLAEVEKCKYTGDHCDGAE